MISPRFFLQADKHKWFWWHPLIWSRLCCICVKPEILSGKHMWICGVQPWTDYPTETARTPDGKSLFMLVLCLFVCGLCVIGVILYLCSYFVLGLPDTQIYHCFLTSVLNHFVSICSYYYYLASVFPCFDSLWLFCSFYRSSGTGATKQLVSLDLCL